MNNLRYYKCLLLSKIFGGGNEQVVDAFRKEGVKIGKGTHIFSNIAASEPYLVKIGANCTISTDVSLITHDASVGLFLGREMASDLCGRITIGDNCFIGNRAIILYGVSIPDNTIVAAGSVVTRSVTEPGCILGGNPAKIIGRVDDFIERNKKKMLSLHRLDEKENVSY